ncbi:hypothetical protein BC941DRAFT_447232 [Chlamydoabsidia padenii]|nr:hypothetical protein BC941DRAFT_447232 [Chlamydoabsidia padenii]
MATQDIISQLRDLQMAIDDFTDLNNTATVSSENYSGQHDIPETIESSSPSPSPPTTTPDIRQYEEKALIEEKQKSLMDSVLPFQLSADDDFSSLLDQLNDIQLSPTSSTTTNHDSSSQHEYHTEKTLISPTSSTNRNTAADSLRVTTTGPVITPTTIINNSSSQIDHGEKHWLEDDTTPHHQPRPNRPPLPNYASCSSFSSSSVSGATSTLSINSRRSARSYKSIMGNSSNGKQRSALITSSSSTITNPTRRSANRYHARTYDEMMRIPDIHERIRFYDKTYQLCIRSDSALSTWIKKFKEKGIPRPLLEGM